MCFTEQLRVIGAVQIFLNEPMQKSSGFEFHDNLLTLVETLFSHELEIWIMLFCFFLGLGACLFVCFFVGLWFGVVFLFCLGVFCWFCCWWWFDLVFCFLGFFLRDLTKFSTFTGF